MKNIKKLSKKLVSFFIFPYVFSFSIINNLLCDTHQQLWNFFVTTINFFIKPIKFGIPSHLALGSSPFLYWGIQLIHVFYNQSQELLKKLVSFLFFHTFFLFQLLIIYHVICVNNCETFCYNYKLFHKTDQIWHSFSFGNWLVSFPELGHIVHVFCNQSQSCKLQFLCWPFPPIIGDIIYLVQQKYNSLTNIVNS